MANNKPYLDPEIAKQLADAGVIDADVAQAFMPNQSTPVAEEAVTEELQAQQAQQGNRGDAERAAIAAQWSPQHQKNVQESTQMGVQAAQGVDPTQTAREQLLNPENQASIQDQTAQMKALADVEARRAQASEQEASILEAENAEQYQNDLKAIQAYNEQALRAGLPLKPEPTPEQYGLPKQMSPENQEKNQEQLEQKTAEQVLEKETQKEVAKQDIQAEAQQRRIKDEQEKAQNIQQNIQKVEQEVAPQIEKAAWFQPGSISFIIAAALAGGAGVASGRGGNTFLEAYQKRIDQEAAAKKWTEEQKLAAEKLTLEKLKFALDTQAQQVGNQKTLAEIDKLRAETQKALQEKNNSLADKEALKYSEKKYWEGKDAAEKIEPLSAQYTDTLKSLRDYGKGGAGTGLVASAKSYLGSLAPETQALQNKFNSINLKNLVQTFQGFARSIDTETERRAWDKTQPDLANDDWVNAAIIYNAQAALMAQKLEQQAKDSYRMSNGSMLGYQSPVARQYEPMIDQDGETIKLVHKNQVEQAIEAGLLPPGEAARVYFGGKRAPRRKQ